MTPEGEVKRKVKGILREWEVDYFMPGAGAYGIIGVSDFIAWPRGLFLVIEAKATAADRLTPLQIKFQQRVRDGGGVALVIHKDNYDLLTSTLRRMLRGERL